MCEETGLGLRDNAARQNRLKVHVAMPAEKRLSDNSIDKEDYEYVVGRRASLGA